MKQGKPVIRRAGSASICHAYGIQIVPIHDIVTLEVAQVCATSAAVTMTHAALVSSAKITLVLEFVAQTTQRLAPKGSTVMRATDVPSDVILMMIANVPISAAML